MDNIKDSKKLELNKVLIQCVSKNYKENCGGSAYSIAVRIDNADEHKLAVWANNNRVSTDMFDTYYSDTEDCEELAILLIDKNTKYEDSDGKEITFNDLEPGFIVNLTAHACFLGRQLYTDSDRINLCVLDNIKVVRKKGE